MDVFKLFGSIGVDTAAADKGLADVRGKAQGAADDIGGLWQDSSGKWRNALGQYATEAEMSAAGIADENEKSASRSGAAWLAMGKVVAGALAAAGTAAVALGAGVVKAYGELEQNLGGADAVFGQYADAIKQKGVEAYKTLGLSQSDYLSTANKMGALFQGSGIEQQRSLELTSAAMQRAADMASVMGIDMEFAMESVAGAAKGNFTMMDNLGVAMNATAINAYAASKGMTDFSFETASMAEKTEMAMQMFLENTGQYAGNFEREATETISGSFGLLKASVGSLMAGLGDANADVSMLAGNVVSAFSTVVDNVIPIIQNLAAALPVALAEVVPALTEVLPVIVSAIVGLLPGLLHAALTLFRSLVEAVALVLPELLTALLNMLPMIVSTVLALIPTLLETAVALFIALAEALPIILPQILAAIIALLPDIVNTALSLLPVILDTAVTLFMALVQALPIILPRLLTTILGLLPTIISTLIGMLPQLINAATKLFMALVEAIPIMLPMLIRAIPQIISAIVSTIAQSGPQLLSAGQALIQGFIDGIGSMIGAVGDVVGGIMDFVGGFFPHSPAKRGPLSGAGWRAIGSGGAAIMDEFQRGLDSVDVEAPLKDVTAGLDAVIRAGVDSSPLDAAARAVAGGTSPLAISSAQSAQADAAGLLRAILGVLSQYLPELRDMDVRLDSGELVGALAPTIDKELGDLAKRKGRGDR